LAGFGGTEVGVEGTSLLPVAAGQAEVAVGVVAIGEAVMGTGLLVLLAYLAG
jgi:hypothetical protein